MDNAALHTAFSELSTALIADAAVRLKIPLRVAPPALRPLDGRSQLAGRACPVRHYGSVDIFLEAISRASQGDVLVIDNGGRLDEACIGDLSALETKTCGLAGMVVWGLHRDTAELMRIGFPVFSLGCTPVGPRRLDTAEPDALRSARLGEFAVTAEDAVFGDADGVVVVPGGRLEQLLPLALQIAQAERHQADALRSGRTLQEQLRFKEYLTRSSAEPGYTFRKHLRAIGGAIEE
jgi:4-hydroxy-4-methyl-2-oxoglutarate aldolase